MFDDQNRFVLEQYGRRPPFSSFLPGVAGALGIPVWCYYNNRGQCVCSFGSADKDHSIMEFSPAHTAYQNVQRTGFRTFVRVDGAFCEPFADSSGEMHIGANELEIRWRGEALEVRVRYFVLPEEPVGALARVVTLRCRAQAPLSLEVLDGMPALIPYGVNQDGLKNMTQLAKAWMQAEDTEKGLAYYRTRASMADSTVVTRTESGNFALAECGGERLRAVARPDLLFGQDTALAVPEIFCREGLAAVLRAAETQVVQNVFPCAFFGKSDVLAPGGELTLCELYGQVRSREVLAAFAARCGGENWFEAKAARARVLTDELCAAIDTRTADPVFDAYCRQTYLDNLLRGGVPTVLEKGGSRSVFYLYSRKHGDPEREYNYFVMSPEYYSQGNGNFRDVNQNRRCDVLFEPRVEDANIRLFFSLLQSDGYNPLVIETMRFTLARPDAALAQVPAAARAKAAALLGAAFTPGALAMAAEGWGFADAAARADFVCGVLAEAEAEPRASFGEGYWTDHWTYDLDLIESYLAVYPERERALLFGGRDLPWFETRALVLPREKRYQMTDRGLRQYASLDTARKADTKNRWMKTRGGCGKTAFSSLAEKLVVLCALKYATLDAAGMGVEMEGGKPGWYDALNGLPALLGSSMAESCELARLLAYTAGALERFGGSVTFYIEMAELVEALANIAARDLPPRARWNAVNDCKEAYRERTADGVEGARRRLSAAGLAAALRRFEGQVRAGIDRAAAYGGGICPAYFTFRAESVQKTAGGLLPGELTPEALPCFLEGPVRWLKLDCPRAEKEACLERVRASGLYDARLHMYKVNESMAGVSFEAGRALAFTPGWLENESVWLHMEYKYLLEELKSGLYPAFERDFFAAAVPFLDPDVYGRSPLENVSFIASSANPDPACRGRGFVARLSGSTAEFLQMWQILLFGARPFAAGKNGLTLALRPYIPARLMPADGTVRGMFLGSVPVTYAAPGLASLVPGQYRVAQYVLTLADGSKQTFAGETLPEEAALAVRERCVKAIRVTIGA